MRVKFEATDATGKVHKRSSMSHIYSHCVVIDFAAHPPSRLSPKGVAACTTLNGWEAVRWPSAKPAAGARTRMSRPSRSSRRGKCDVTLRGQELGKLFPCKADLSGPTGADALAALFVATGSIGVGVPMTLKSPTTTSNTKNNAAADRRHHLDLDHLRTDRACAGGRAAFCRRRGSTMRDQHHIAGDQRRAQFVDRAMTLQEAKSIARHLGLTLRELLSGDYRVNFAMENATTAYYTDDLEDAVNPAVEMARTRGQSRC